MEVETIVITPHFNCQSADAKHSAPWFALRAAASTRVQHGPDDDPELVVTTKYLGRQVTGLTFDMSKAELLNWFQWSARNVEIGLGPNYKFTLDTDNLISEYQRLAKDWTAQ